MLNTKNSKSSKVKLIYLYTANQVYLKMMWANYKLYFLLHILISILMGLSSPIAALAPKLFIDYVTKSKRLDYALWVIVAMLLHRLLWRIVSHITNVYEDYATNNVIIHVKRQIMMRIAQIDMAYFDNPESYNMITRAITYADNGGTKLIRLVSQIIRDIIGLIGVSILLSLLNWWLVLCLVIMSGMETYIKNHVSRKGFYLRKDMTNKERVASYYYNILYDKENTQDIKAYNCVNYFLDRYERIRKDNVRYRIDKEIGLRKVQLASEIPFSAFIFLPYVYTGYRLINGLMSVSDYFMFFNAMWSFNGYLEKISSYVNDIYKNAMEACNYIEFIKDDKNIIPNPKNAIPLEDGIRSIEYRGVTFNYTGQRENALNNISFTIRAGERVAIVGYNGAGKTTLVKLLLKLYQPSSGVILINGHDINKYNSQDVRQTIATVFQNHKEYALTIGENVAMHAYDESNNEKIWDALQKVGLKGKITSFKKQLETPLTRQFETTGIDLSGGERQKLAIARAIFKDGSVLVLDEPSSALDPIAEYELYKVIEQTNRNKIVVFISHRLANVILADKIIFISKGNIEAIGSHEELMTVCQEYRNMYNVQAEKYRKVQ